MLKKNPFNWQLDGRARETINHAEIITTNSLRVRNPVESDDARAALIRRLLVSIFKTIPALKRYTDDDALLAAGMILPARAEAGER